MAISCKTIEESKISIPTYTEARPTRPMLDEEAGIITNFYEVSGYAKKLEIYSSSLEDYIETLKEILKK